MTSLGLHLLIKKLAYGGILTCGGLSCPNSVLFQAVWYRSWPPATPPEESKSSGDLLLSSLPLSLLWAKLGLAQPVGENCYEGVKSINCIMQYKKSKNRDSGAIAQQLVSRSRIQEEHWHRKVQNPKEKRRNGNPAIMSISLCLTWLLSGHPAEMFGVSHCTFIWMFSLVAH